MVYRALNDFRVVVLIELHKPTPRRISDGGSGVPPMIGFYRSYGVLAQSYSEAAGFVEDFIARTEAEEPEFSDSVGGMEIDRRLGMPAVDPELSYIQSPDQPGVYFATGRAFFDRFDEGEPN